MAMTTTHVPTVTTPQGSRSNHCHRCGGLMISEKVFEFGSCDWHCLSCGDRIDPVILAHRQAQGLAARETAKTLVTGTGPALSTD